ncbi:GerMN domain-containing protein [Micrococcales bacterium 31B]|nr:GerMN domain-containing protein [Micrococcales bacterium 31B]
MTPAPKRRARGYHAAASRPFATEAERQMARQTRALATITYALIAVAALSLVGFHLVKPAEAPGIVVSGSAPGPRNTSLHVTESGPAPRSDPATLVADYLWSNSIGSAPETLANYFVDPQANATIAADEQRVVIFDEAMTPTFTFDNSGTVTVSVVPLGIVDSEGYFTAVTGTAAETLRVQVQPVAEGEWRLASQPTPITGVISLSAYLSTHTRRDAVFIAPAQGRLVATSRWVPGHDQAQALMEQLVKGPGSRYPTLSTSLAGLSLAAPVQTLDQVTTVALTAPQGVSEERRGVIASQVKATLTPVLPGQEVTLLLNGAASTLQLPDNGVPDTKIDGMNSQASVVALDSGGELVQLLSQATRQQKVEIEAFAGKAVDSYATGMGGTAVAIVTDNRHTLIGWTGVGSEQSFTLESDLDARDPSIDDYGWFWLPSETNSGTVVAAQSRTEVATVETPGLAGEKIIQAAVSPDGTHFMALVGDAQQQTLWVAPVERDGTGRPLRLGPLRTLGGNLTSISSATWAGSGAIAVTAQSSRIHADEAGRVMDLVQTRDNEGPRAFVVTLDGPAYVIPGITGVQTLAVNLATNEAYASTAAGRSLYYGGGRWMSVGLPFTNAEFSF